MSRLLNSITLLLLLLAAAQPASGVMNVQPENRTMGFFSLSPTATAPGDAWPAIQDSAMDAAAWSYESALDVRDGPNLYAYVRQNPWTSFDPDGLTGWGVHFPNATSSNSMTNNKEYRNSYMQTAGKGLLVGTVAAVTATGVGALAAPYIGTGFVSAAVSNGVGGYVANGVSNKMEGGDFNDNAGTAIATGAAGGVLFHGLMRGGSPGGNSPVRGRAPSQPSEEFISGEPPNSSSAAPPPGASPTATARPNAPLPVTEQTIAKALEGSGMKTLQPSVSRPVVENYVRRLEAGDKPPAISVDGDIIVEGNHRFVAGRVFGTEPPTKPGTAPMSLRPKAEPVSKMKVKEEDFGNR